MEKFADKVKSRYVTHCHVSQHPSFISDPHKSKVGPWNSISNRIELQPASSPDYRYDGLLNFPRQLERVAHIVISFIRMAQRQTLILI
jgi:hypothetical protein